MYRIGVGFDAHPFEDGRKLFLGGLEITHPAGLAGHSDGDVLLHAIADALLGASGSPSLGELFDDRDPRWAGSGSGGFLVRARELARQAGLSVANVDAVVIGEEPKIAPHAPAIRGRVASLLEAPESRVSVRGTSSNGLGFAGRGEGLAAVAVVLLERRG